MKLNTAVAIVTIASGLLAAYWTYRQLRGPSSATATPPGNLMYSAAQPFGYVWNPTAGAYQATGPDGVVRTYT